MQLVPLTPAYPLVAFDCGDDDLNRFLLDDAKHAQVIGLAASLVEELRIANTFILEDEGRIAAYFCLLNDRISRSEITGSRWKKIRAKFPVSKQFRSYPCIKVGRFAVSVDYHGQSVGTWLMNKLKERLNVGQNQSAFRYITVDAYLSAIEFYRKNGFQELTKKEEDEHTRLMFFDMMDVE